MKKVFVTGATGTMGGETMNRLLERKDKFEVVVLNRPSDKNKKAFEKYQGVLNLTIKWGDITNYNDVLDCMRGIDYVIHCAAFVSPAADRYPAEAMKINYGGTLNIINAIKAQKHMDNIKLVYVGTVAETGDRMPPIHWGRVGDPLKPSTHDYYAVSKIAAERAVIESGLNYWVSIRQSGMASMKEFAIQDGIMFHQPLNNIQEWTTAYDSGVLCANACEDWVDDRFWGHIYNIGGGKDCRLTTYELTALMLAELGFDDARKTMEPNWFATHNFHGQAYLDSDKLENLLHFRSQTMYDFIKFYGENMRKVIMKQSDSATKKSVGKDEMVEQIKISNQNVALCDTGTLNWVLNNKEEHISPFFINKEKWAKIAGWDKFVLYKPLDVVRHIDHGYDESKPESELTLEDMQQAAKFRGGICNSISIKKGDWSQKLEFTCAFGHHFTGSPRLVLEGGHWCDECERKSWNYQELAKHSPFFAQVWYPLHDEDEPVQTFPKIVKDTDVE